MAIKPRWRKSSFSGVEDNCVFLAGTLDAVWDNKSGAVLPANGLRTLVQLVQVDDRFTLPTS